MRHLLYIFLFFFLLFSCKSSIKKNNTTSASAVKSAHQANLSNQQSVDDTAEIDPSTIGCVVSPYIYGSNNEEDFSPGTFGKITYVYNSMQPGAKTIDSLPFNTTVNILKEYPEFYLVCTPKAKSGYIKKTDLYLNKFFESEDSGMYYYLAGLSKYPPKQELDINPANCQTSILKIVKINEKSSKILNVYTDSIMGKNYTIKHVYSVALKNVKSIYHINYSCMEDIETDADVFIVDNGKKISRLISTSSSGDGGYGDGSILYLPVKLTMGKKIVLAKDGALTIDATTAKPELYPYPADCGIPIDELVVEQYWSEADDSDGTPEYNSDGTAVQHTTLTSTIYYRWDGNTLKKIKTIESK